MKKWMCLGLCLMLSLSACGETVEVTPSATPAPVVTPSPTPVPVTNPLSLPVTQGGLDPLTSWDSINRSLFGLVWEGLFALDGNFDAQPVLCSHYTIDETGLVWTLTLTDAQFSDGSPVTAGDVVHSLNIARAEGNPYAIRLAGIRNVKAVSDSQVAVTLSSPNGALDCLLTVPIVSAETGLGTGAYVLQDQALIANDGWWTERGGKPEADTIPLTHIPEAGDLIYAFDTGSITMVVADLTSPTALGYAGGGYEVLDYPTTSMEYLGFNCNGGATADPLVRQALSYGIQRETITAALYARHAQPATLPIHPLSDNYPTAVAGSLAYDRNRVEELLLEAGYQKNDDGRFAKYGQPLSLTLVVNSDNSFRLSVANYLASTMAEMGVTITLEKLAWVDYVKALEWGKFDLYLGGAALTADFDPTALLVGDLNYGDYQSDPLDDLLTAYLGATEGARLVAATQLGRHLANTMPIAPICFKDGSVLMQWGAVDGLAPTQEQPYGGVAGVRLTTND